MKILVTGASGTIGRALVEALVSRDHEVLHLVRRAPVGPDEVLWNPSAGAIDQARLEGLDAVIHLAGESIAGRWTAAKKARIRSSRVAGTALLSRALARQARRPEVLVAASAVGYYGNRDGEILTEESPAGSGFLAEVVREWEAAAEPARHAGIRVVHLRTGFVLSATGGGLAALLTPFKLGLGGRIGSGRQMLSWIALDDLVGVFLRALSDPTLSGPVNAVAPTPVDNLEFTKTLAAALHRPAFLPLPEWAVRTLLGEMGEELLLCSQNVQPAKLLDEGFHFRFPELEPALHRVLSKR
jgi:uncharacterized protein